MSQNVDSWQFSCPRCGAGVGEPCAPVRATGWATTLREHHERGMSLGQLSGKGYRKETLRDDGGFQVTLWRKPGTPRVEIPGFERQP